MALTVTSSLHAQTGKPAAPMILRSQASSIIEEAWPKLSDSLDRGGTIAVVVEGAPFARVVENALLEFLGGHGARPFLGTQAGQGGVLIASVLQQDIEYQSLADGNVLRRVRTALELRRTGSTASDLRFAGPFTRNQIDTVASRDDVALLRSTEEQSFVERIVGPLLLIGGSFLVVYLFFTVRN